MADNRSIHHWLRVVRQVKIWQLLLLLMLLVVLSAFLLRQNNLRMVELRDAVIAADANGQPVKEPLLNLQRYVSEHMNTELGAGISLQGAYKRAYDAAVEKAMKTKNPNSQIYARVELECRPVFQRTGSFPAYTECAHEKLSKLSPGKDALSNVNTPSSDLYKYNFVSPAWSPDGAGLTILLTGVVTLILLARVITYFGLRAMLRSHQ